MTIDEFLRVHDLPTFAGILPEWVRRGAQLRFTPDQPLECCASQDMALFVLVWRSEKRFWIGRHDPELEKLNQIHTRLWAGSTDESYGELDHGFPLPQPENIPAVYKELNLPT